MALIKTKDDIEHIRTAGKILAEVLREVGNAVRPGVTTFELDALAEKLIREKGCSPSFKDYQPTSNDTPFPSTLCTSVNEEVVHAPASDRTLQEGDIIGIDVGLKYTASGRDFFADTAKTYPVGGISSDAKKLLEVTSRALDIGLARVKAGNTTADVGRAVQDYVEAQGFSVVRSLVGHGVGHAIHEEPQIPNYYRPDFPVVEFQKGMVVAVEPMVNAGGYRVRIKGDGWTIATQDKSLSAHFEHTVAVTDKGCEILTR